MLKTAQRFLPWLPLICLALAAILFTPSVATAQGTYTVLHIFSGDGTHPHGSLTLASDGNLIGVTNCDCSAPTSGILGTIYRITPAGVVTTLHVFRGGAADGASPWEAPILATDGNFYGTTSQGGPADLGTAYRMTPDGTVTVLQAFTGSSDGSRPGSTLIQAADGDLYGTTAVGGSNGYGTIFRISLSGAFSVVYSFASVMYQSDPGSYDLLSGGGLIQATDGSFYGTGCGAGDGSIFQLTPTGTFTLVHQFSRATEGFCPRRLVQAGDGNFYGTTLGSETVSFLRIAGSGQFAFKVTPSGTFSVLTPLFKGEPVFSALIQGTDGNLYGITEQSLNVFGHVFRMTRTGQVTVLLNGTDVGPSLGSLVQAPDGTFYGTTLLSPETAGVVFSLTVPPAPTSNPLMTLDIPVAASTQRQPFALGGWAVDLGAPFGDGVDAVHVWATPTSGGPPTFVGVADFGRSRPDVAAVYGPAYTESGYLITVTGLAPGTYTLTAYAHSTVTGTFNQARTATVTIDSQPPPPSDPLMALDIPVAASTQRQPFALGGWAVDLGALFGDGVDAVHVWATPTSGGPPTFVGVADFGGSRPDVAAVYGPAYTDSGYLLTVTGLAPGTTYTLTAYAHSTVTGTFNQARTVTVTIDSQPVMTLDVPGQGAIFGGSFSVAGWAIDLAAATGSGVTAVHVWAVPTNGGSPIFLGPADYGRPRADVAAIYGAQFLNSGYRFEGLVLPPGQYVLVAYALSRVTGTFNQSRSATVTVVAARPMMSVDVPSMSSTVAQPFGIGGWAIDLNATSGTGVDVVVVWAYPDFGSGAPAVFLGVAAYGGPRSDVGAAFGSQFTNSAFFLTPPTLPGGSYKLCVYAHSTVSGVFSAVRTLDIVVLPASQ